MKKISFLIIILTCLGSSYALKGNAADKALAKFQHNEKLDYYYCFPREYDEESTTSKKYPLVVYLHGGGGYGKISNNLNYLGYSEDGEPIDSVAMNFQLKFPSFVFVPQAKNGPWNAGTLAPLIEDFKSNYPIDNARIYLIGYSMGGSGSYIIANGCYNYNQMLFAGIIRLAGQSQTELADAIVENTSVWLHIGLDDEPKRIQITRQAFDHLKAKYPKVDHIMDKVEINGITGTTVTLEKKDGVEAKKNEYDNVGHGISRFPFDNPQLLSWLFNQKLK